MTVLAHAGHWLVQITYLLPLVVMGALLVRGRLRDHARRRERRRDGPPVDDA